MHHQALQKKKNHLLPTNQAKLKRLEVISFFGKLTDVFAFFILLVIVFVLVTNQVNAQSLPGDLFLVPEIAPTQSGPKLFPDGNTGKNLPTGNLLDTNVRNTSADPTLNPTPYTPKNYLPPQYDAFNADYKKPVILSPEKSDSAPTADFTILTKPSGLGDRASGTINTWFIFDAHASTDIETSSGLLEARWDFENDGEVDSYFSRVKNIQHKFEKPGIYNVKVEVLDKAGNISTAVKQVTVVENTEPFAHFTVDQNHGTSKSIFTFNTALSSDSQYQSSMLAYRFDWNSDGKWDTTLQKKNIWNHRFDEVGAYLVTMEVQDPEGLSVQAQLTVEVEADSGPVASFSIERVANRYQHTFNQYYFDASASSDDHTSSRNLLYRWDFNYTGPNDIVFDTSFSSSPTYSGRYFIGGHKVIRLQVMDEEGNMSEEFAAIDVPWIEAESTL